MHNDEQPNIAAKETCQVSEPSIEVKYFDQVDSDHYMRHRDDAGIAIVVTYNRRSHVAVSMRFDSLRLVIDRDGNAHMQRKRRRTRWVITPGWVRVNRRDYHPDKLAGGMTLGQLRRLYWQAYNDITATQLKKCVH